MSIISPADFTVDNELPNKSLQGNDIQAHIDKREPEFLELLLGSDMYEAYEANPAEARFTDLIAKKWFKSAIVDYVYWFYLSNQSIMTLNTGGGQPKKQNAVTVSLYPKMVAAWNEMVDYNKKTNKFLKDNPTIYPEYASVNLPYWFYINGYYPSFDWGWYFEYGQNELHEIYRYRNSLGL